MMCAYCPKLRHLFPMLLARMKPSLPSWPHTAAADSVTSFKVKVGRDVADRFNFGVILGQRELSLNSLPPLSFSTWLMANFLSEMMGLVGKESISHSRCSCSHVECDGISHLLWLGPQDPQTCQDCRQNFARDSRTLKLFPDSRCFIVHNSLSSCQPPV